MKIIHTDIYKLNIPLIHPIIVPIGRIDAAENVVVQITTDTGLTGWGEASPFEPITGDTQQGCYEISKQLGKLIAGKNPLAIEARMNEISDAAAESSSIRSAFDMALYDILAKAADMPLYALLGGEPREIRTDMSIGLQETVEDTLEHTESILKAGFDSIKLKVGRPGLADVEHVSAVRERVGPDVQIKVDSNQGWDYETALANLREMEALNIEYSEQPVAAKDHDNLARLRAELAIPICADESVFDHRDALKLVRAGAVDYLNIKLGKSGGIHTALKIDAIAQAADCRCMIGCFADSRLALTAAAHVALARPNITFLDLDSAYIFTEDPVIGGVRYDDNIGGLLHVSDEPGLGAAFNEKYLREAFRA